MPWLDTFSRKWVEMLTDKCSLDKLAEAPGSRRLDLGQPKNYHHSREEEENIEHCLPQKNMAG